MSQLSASAVFTPNSKAFRFITGSEPGSPRQTGQVCTFGCVGLNSVEQPQKILLFVSNWTWTSRPMMVVMVILDEEGLSRIPFRGTFKLGRWRRFSHSDQRGSMVAVKVDSWLAGNYSASIANSRNFRLIPCGDV